MNGRRGILLVVVLALCAMVLPGAVKLMRDVVLASHVAHVLKGR